MLKTILFIKHSAPLSEFHQVKKKMCVCGCAHARVCVWGWGGVAVAVDTLYLIPDSQKWSAYYSFVTYIGASACNVLMTAPVYLEL